MEEEEGKGEQNEDTKSEQREVQTWRRGVDESKNEEYTHDSWKKSVRMTLMKNKQERIILKEKLSKNEGIN